MKKLIARRTFSRNRAGVMAGIIYQVPEEDLAQELVEQGDFYECKGQLLNVEENGELFKAIGYKYSEPPELPVVRKEFSWRWPFWRKTVTHWEPNPLYVPGMFRIPDLHEHYERT